MAAGLFIFCFYALLTYPLYLAVRPFVVKSKSSHVVLFCGLFVFTYVAIAIAWDLLAAGQLQHERQTQRIAVSSRIFPAGGWAALQKDCDNLVISNQGGVFFWNRGSTNVLPLTLAALKPSSVQFYSPEIMSASKDSPQVAVVRIKVFGMHSTGGHSTPYFGLEVVSGIGAESYKPKPSQGGVSGNGYHSYNAVTDRIYEIY